jgi:arylsulfatase
MVETERSLVSRASKTIRQLLGATALTVAATIAMPPADAQAQPAAQHPNILFIMADDIGWMQVGVYHRGLALGETPNIDRIAQEGGQFMDYYAMQSCTSGRNAFFTGHRSVRQESPR